MRVMTRIAMFAVYVIAGWPGVDLLGDGNASVAASRMEIESMLNEHSLVEEKENRSE